MHYAPVTIFVSYFFLSFSICVTDQRGVLNQCLIVQNSKFSPMHTTIMRWWNQCMLVVS